MLISDYITPVMYVDPSGRFPDWIIDIPLLLIGLKDFYENPTWAKAGWLTIDIVLTLLPFVPALASVRHLNKIDDGLEALKTINSVENFLDAGGIIRRANQLDFTTDAWKIVNSLDNVNDYTKSTTSAGIKIHKGFMNGGRKINAANRVDGVNHTMKIVYELKPYNVRSIQRGIKQLYRYQNVLYDATGHIYKMILILY